MRRAGGHGGLTDRVNGYPLVLGMVGACEKEVVIPARDATDWTAKILQGLKVGDDRAARDLVERFTPALWRFSRRMLRGHSLRGVRPEDLVQETWTQALAEGSILSYERREPGKLQSWLFSVLEHKAKDLRKRQETLKRAPSEFAFSIDRRDEHHPEGIMPPSPDTSPTSNARFDDLVDFCHEVLTPREWSLWRLVELEGYSIVEAAKTSRCTDSAARSLLHRARVKLLRALEEAPDGGLDGTKEVGE